MTAGYWDGHFPIPPGQLSYWGGHFPEDGTVPDTGLPPIGIATFALDLDAEAQVTFAWRTGMFKSYAGTERRSNLIDDPAQQFQGSAILTGSQTRAVRSRLARYAATAQPFLLGLPYEELTLRAAAAGMVLPVSSTALSDWCVIGGRVVVKHATYGYVNAVIAAVGPDTITINVAPGNVGKLGARVMPALAVYLQPEQAFSRARTELERWNIKASNAIAGFASTALTAALSLNDPLTHSGVLANLTIYARTSGAGGNDIVVTQSDDSLGGMDILEDVLAGTVHIKYEGDVTTVAEYIAAVNVASELVYVDGTYNGADVLVSVEDEFPATNLAGGADVIPAEVGRGATVATFLGWPVWDRRIKVDDTVEDSMHSMTTVQDIGGLPFADQSATVSDWGRAVAMLRPLGIHWQWAKRFFDEVRGSWRSWWLASWREDLLPIAVGVGTLTVQSGEDAGDFFAWWPSQQRYLQLRASDDTLTLAQIVGATDNGNGTITITITDEDDNPISPAVVPSMVSWLERVRFEQDAITVRFKDQSFAIAELARVVQQSAEGAGGAFEADEASVELSQPREGIEINHGIVNYRIGTSTRDYTMGGATFRASPAARGAATVREAKSGDDTITISLPLTHPFAVRWLSGGTPPQYATVKIWRLQLESNESVIEWQGVITEMQPDQSGHVAVFTATTEFSRALGRRQWLTASRACPLVLGDANCTVDVEALKVATNVTTYDGRTIEVAGVGGNPTGWADGGRVRHVATGELMAVFSQTGTTLVLQFAIVGLQLGDEIEILPSCDKSFETCDVKFNNVLNFGNPSLLPLTNIHRITGIGAVL